MIKPKSDEYSLREALKEAQKPDLDIPIGAVIVSNNRILQELITLLTFKYVTLMLKYKHSSAAEVPVEISLIFLYVTISHV